VVSFLAKLLKESVKILFCSLMIFRRWSPAYYFWFALLLGC
jgi:hypothetical protein